MKYTVKPTARFQKDLKRIQRRGSNTPLFTACNFDAPLLAAGLLTDCSQIANGEPLLEKNQDHALSGEYSGFSKKLNLPIDNPTLL